MKKSLAEDNRIQPAVAIRNVLRLFLVMICALSTSPGISASSAARSQSTSSTVNPVRNCKPGKDEPLGKKKSPSPKNKSRTAVQTPPIACLEVRQSALLVQEFLQKVVRDLRWTVADEQATEDFWNFSIPIDAEELASYTKPAPELRISWSAGKASVTARTTELSDGYTQVVVTAKIEGYGTQEDSFATKRQSWPLTSNGGIEAKLIGSVKEHFTSAR
jgi:hypothetical protein